MLSILLGDAGKQRYLDRKKSKNWGVVEVQKVQGSVSMTTLYCPINLAMSLPLKGWVLGTSHIKFLIFMPLGLKICCW